MVRDTGVEMSRDTGSGEQPSVPAGAGGFRGWRGGGLNGRSGRRRAAGWAAQLRKRADTASPACNPRPCKCMLAVIVVHNGAAGGHAQAGSHGLLERADCAAAGHGRLAALQVAFAGPRRWLNSLACGERRVERRAQLSKAVGTREPTRCERGCVSSCAAQHSTAQHTATQQSTAHTSTSTPAPPAQ